MPLLYQSFLGTDLHEAVWLGKRQSSSFGSKMLPSGHEWIIMDTKMILHFELFCVFIMFPLKWKFLAANNITIIK